MWPFGHLGDDAGALADGSLDEAGEARARAHLDGCDACTDLVRQQQRQRRLTSSLGAVEVPTSLQDRLLALTAADAADAGTDRPRAPWESTPRRSPIRLVAVAAVSVMGLGVVAGGSLVVLGASRTTSPERLTALAAEPMPGGADAVVVETSDGGTDAWPTGWTSPAELPTGTELVTVSELSSGDLRVELSVEGEAVTVLETHGVVDLTDVEVTRSVRVGQLEVHLVGDWWLTQAGGEVVAVTSTDEDLSLSVIREFDASGAPGVLESLSRGWQVIAGG
ncbi:hypothetical protein C8046_06355 [Serinibacter arcticus]|uniref:Putative zinc-finger domain-containing protein n=1 Tax=Serinibacter arcticus TaxID=1655435 RepID=A0A2U1ZTR9_9MICO|nr:zf-HC2 domain-containing protein [Serinibacter arcticus]PWD50333.1 hypothetical protein C8046_06355 [Serinibacter arcticus]